jgi:hypothetical protein
MPYQGVEVLLIPWLAEQIGVRCLTDLPADLQQVLPIVQVVRVGGPSHDDNPRFDMPTVSVDCFAEDRNSATGLALDVDEAIREVLPGQTTGGATVTRVQSITGPHWVPYDDTNLRHFNQSYRLFIKCSRAS